MIIPKEKYIKNNNKTDYIAFFDFLCGVSDFENQNLLTNLQLLNAL